MSFLIINNELTWQRGHLVLELVEDNFRFYTEGNPATITAPPTCTCEPWSWSVESAGGALTDLTLCAYGVDHHMIAGYEPENGGWVQSRDYGYKVPALDEEGNGGYAAACDRRLMRYPTWVDKASYDAGNASSSPVWKIVVGFSDPDPFVDSTPFFGIGAAREADGGVPCSRWGDPNYYRIYNNGSQIGNPLDEENGLPPTYDYTSHPNPLWVDDIGDAYEMLPIGYYGNQKSGGSVDLVVFDTDDSVGQGIDACPLCYDATDMASLSRDKLYICFYSSSSEMYEKIEMEYDYSYGVSPMWKDSTSYWILSWGECSHNTLYATNYASTAGWILENSNESVDAQQSSSSNTDPSGDYGGYEVSYTDPGSCCYDADSPEIEQSNLPTSYFLCFDTDGTGSYLEGEMTRDLNSSGVIYVWNSEWILSWGGCYDETGYGSDGDDTNVWVLEFTGSVESPYAGFSSTLGDSEDGPVGHYSDFNISESADISAGSEEGNCA